MKLFLDTAAVEEVEALVPSGLVDGVTTNPSLIAKSGRPIRDVIAGMCAATPGPVSAEVVAEDAEGMVAQGEILRAVASNVVVKVPLTLAGLEATKRLSAAGHPVNVTLCFSALQALAAAKAGAAFVSPFIGRLDDIGQDGMALIRDIRVLFDNYDELKTEILAASIRGPAHVLASALAGADAATLPPKVIRQLPQHPLTDKGLKAFLDDWARSGGSIT